MNFIDKIREGFFRNPIAWVLLGMFLIAEYGNYQRGRDLTRVCELTGAAHDTRKSELSTICSSRLSDDKASPDPL